MVLGRGSGGVLGFGILNRDRSRDEEIVLVGREVDPNSPRRVLLTYYPDEWQWKVLDTMQKRGYEVAPTLRPIVDKAIAQIKTKLGL